MFIELDYKGSGLNLGFAVADALGVGRSRVHVAVCPPRDLIPFRCDWRVGVSCPDAVVYIDNEVLTLSVI